MSYERENIRATAGYIPGEQPRDIRVVKLNTNENPYPPCQAVIDAIHAVTADSLRRYPPPSAEGFRKAASAAHGVSADRIIATNGGDELLRLVFTAFCEPGSLANHATRGGVGVTEPSYSLYPVLAEIQDTPVLRVNLNDDWSLPADLGQKWNDAGCRLGIVVNPHAPSGRLENIAALEALARSFKGVLVVDEAYVDFAEHDALPLLDEKRGLKNVLLLRTLSKGYSLAGLRFGYGMGDRGLIDVLEKAKDSYTTDILAQAGATAALTHRAEARKTWQAVIAERARVTQQLQRRGFFVAPSHSNFILATAPTKAGTPDAKAIYLALKAKGIFVRYFDMDRLRDKLRITIGTPEQNNELLAELDVIAK
jgi:histidinol-phosphate aminotransferase